jgi:DNA repair photolyase
MASSTAIEWTDATWNPVTGCTKISAGCDHCYAERFSERFRGVPGHPFEFGFDLTLRPERLETPLTGRPAGDTASPFPPGLLAIADEVIE